MLLVNPSNRNQRCCPLGARLHPRVPGYRRRRWNLFRDLKSSTSHDVSLRSAWWYSGTLVFGAGSPPVANAIRGSHGYFLGRSLIRACAPPFLHDQRFDRPLWRYSISTDFVIRGLASGTPAPTWADTSNHSNPDQATDLPRMRSYSWSWRPLHIAFPMAFGDTFGTPLTPQLLFSGMGDRSGVSRPWGLEAHGI